MAQLETIKLDEYLGAGQYIQIRHPGKLPWGIQKQIQLGLKDDTRESQVDFVETLAKLIIVNGNVMDDEGVPVTLPLTDESLERCPGVVLEEAAAKFAELKKAVGNLEKK